ncbi:UNVERIFIED_CONTAM: hypothetical protein GTU68_008553 [Idotea baltica]|nr:hypothetical protein [Idotea baltica]
MAAIHGGTQSLHTNALDEAIALPTDFSAKIARDTQLILQRNIDLTKAIDPWGGSRVIEKRTQELIEQANNLINEVEELGGMSKAIELGLPKRRIEEAAARKQARIDAGKDQIVGVNVFQYENTSEDALDILEVDNIDVLQAQLSQLKNVKSKRNKEAVQSSLNKLRDVVKNNNGNLLAAAVEAARHRATLGEISLALEETAGRYVPKSEAVVGIYRKEAKDMQSVKDVLILSDRFARQEGRRARIMVAKLGQDGHDRGAKVIASSFADLGFDVDIGPLFQTPEEAAKQAVENDVHILGISSLAAGHKVLVPKVITALQKWGREDILVIVGGVIPPSDYPFLFKQGVAGIFGPGTVIPDAAKEILEMMMIEDQS